MSTIDYATMSDQELKRYMLAHREDEQAFHAYMDRRKSRAHRVVIHPDQSDWQEQFQIMIQRQARRGLREQD
jgi:hypothetical protein